jgi:hypothetical protein
MAKLIYFMPTSLDGYIADETGNPDWAAPDEEVFAFINDLVRVVPSLIVGGPTIRISVAICYSRIRHYQFQFGSKSGRNAFARRS